MKFVILTRTALLLVGMSPTITQSERLLVRKERRAVRHLVSQLNIKPSGPGTSYVSQALEMWGP